MRNFYIRKIGSHLQELAVLVMVFVPLDANHLTVRQTLLLFVGAVAMLVIGMEMERRSE